MNKGQGLPISTIILAIIGLLVLVIMGGLVYNKTSLFGEGTREISTRSCDPPNEIKPIGTNCQVIYEMFENVGSNEICCKAESVKE